MVKKHLFVSSTKTGFIVNVVNVDEMVPLFDAKRAIQWFDGYGTTYYIRVTVDDQHNAVCTIASSTPLDKLSDRYLRIFIVSCVSHVFTQVDQSEYFNYHNVQDLANYTTDIVPSTGKPDMEIVRP